MLLNGTAEWHNGRATVALSYTHKHSLSPDQRQRSFFLPLASLFVVMDVLEAFLARHLLSIPIVDSFCVTLACVFQRFCEMARMAGASRLYRPDIQNSNSLFQKALVFL
jgi:hypothetical protein